MGPLSRWRRALVVGTPIVAVATFALGLRVGAKTAVVAAEVYAAPAGERGVYAWQVRTLLDDRGVRETIPVKGVTVAVGAPDSLPGSVGGWSGATNVDGVAEVTLKKTTDGGPVRVAVYRDGDPEPLASAVVDPSTLPAPPRAEAAAVRPTKREGDIDVFVEGGRLVPGFASSLWVHTASKVVVEPDPGLRVTRTTACDGWTEVEVVAEAHVAGASIHAGDALWYGSLPIAPGAFFVSFPRSIEAGKPTKATLVAPNPRDVVYAEIDDARGRDLGAALDVKADPADAEPRASLDVPALHKGIHWLVVSGEPSGAERLDGATLARPFVVGDTRNVCEVGPMLAMTGAGGFPRTKVADGFALRGAKNRAQHAWGLAIAVGSLACAGLIEVLLLVAMARESKKEKGSPGSSLVVAILVALLGFGFLAAMIIAKG